MNSAKQKSVWALANLKRIQSYLSESLKIMLVKQLVLSKLDYCNCLFYNMSSENFNKLQLVQNHAARIVKKASKRDSAMSIMFELHWLPIRYRVSFKIALIVFKCLNVENFPSYLKDLISIYTPSRTLRSSDSLL